VDRIIQLNVFSEKLNGLKADLENLKKEGEEPRAVEGSKDGVDKN